MELYNNQKAIRVVRAEMNAARRYARFDWDALENAMNTLSHGGFRLWIYLCRNKDGYEFALSRKAAMEATGISKPTYLNAVQELIAKRFLIEAELHEGLSGYLFFEEGYEKFKEKSKTTPDSMPQGGDINDAYWEVHRQI